MHQSSTGSPLKRFGLFRNPFGELTAQERAELAVIETASILDWLESSQRAVLQVIGPCGHGKTTHLLALQQAWVTRGLAQGISRDPPVRVYFPEDGDQPALPRSRPLFIDEAQRMKWWRRRQLLKGPGPLVIATHEDMTDALVRANFQLRTLDLDGSMEANRLQTVLNRRVQASQTRSTSEVADYHPLYLTLPQVVALQQRFGSNIRLIEEHLYQRFQCFALKGEPWLPVD